MIINPEDVVVVHVDHVIITQPDHYRVMCSMQDTTTRVYQVCADSSTEAVDYIMARLDDNGEEFTSVRALLIPPRRERYEVV